jgi:hypothetical protein
MAEKNLADRGNSEKQQVMAAAPSASNSVWHPERDNQIHASAGTQGSQQSGGDETPPPWARWTKPTPSSKIAFSEKPKSRKRVLEDDLTQAEPHKQSKKRLLPEEMERTKITGTLRELLQGCVQQEKSNVFVSGPVRLAQTSGAGGGAITIASSSSSSEIDCESAGATRNAELPWAPLRADPDVIRDFTFPEVPDANYNVVNLFQGLIWGDGHRQTVVNTCPMDSFLSHVNYLARSDVNYFARYFNLLDSPGETLLARMARTAPRPSPERQFPTLHELENWSNAVHNRIATLNLARQTPYPRNGMIWDMRAGSPGSSASWYQLFEESSRYYIIHQCQCAEMESALRLENRFYGQTPETLSELSQLSTTNARKLSTKLSSKKCSSCHGNFVVSQGVVSRGTWFVRFQMDRSDDSGIPRVAGNDQFPDEIVMFRDSFAPEIYELGFTEYSTRPRDGFVSHVTSIHRLRDYAGVHTDHFYDSMRNNGRLQPMPPNFAEENVLNYVYYFRKTFR